MNLSSYTRNLLSNFNDTRVSRNAESMIRKIVECKSIRLWSNSENKAEFERSKRLINGSLKSVLDDKKISQALRENSFLSIGNKDRYILLHDVCDIRKEYSRELEKLGKVRSLDNKIINGYSTFNTVVVDELAKEIRLLDTTFYSNQDEQYVTQKEVKKYQRGSLKTCLDKRSHQIEQFIEDESFINLPKITCNQLKRVSCLFKSKNNKIVLCHVLDRAFDGDDYFAFIDQELNDEFVIRLKLSRNSNEHIVDEAGGEGGYIKLKDVEFAHQGQVGFNKVMIKNRVYQNVRCVVKWDKYLIDDRRYWVVRVSLFDHKNNNIFKEPMLLITNIAISNIHQAHSIYRIYLMRPKIEGVFKFLKGVLGFEEFQVRDYESIKNIVTLCYFIGAYFYEIESVLIENDAIRVIAQLGGSKGKVTRHYILEGLKKLLIRETVEQFIKEHNIGDKQLKEMLAFVI